jgi:curved DNA-binding protein CbpA
LVYDQPAGAIHNHDVTQDPIDPYETLHVAPDADDAVITAAYRALARRFHPDLAGDHATGSMAAVNNAWELIGKPAARRAYDREHRPTAATSAPAAQDDAGRSGASGRAGRFATAGDGTGAAGPPPGRPYGSVLPFGRHIGWSLGEIARVDVGYLEWLEDRREGKPYREEIDLLLQRLGRRGEPVSRAGRRR